VLGLVERAEHVTKMGFKEKGESIVVVGMTEWELGGSEYFHMLGLSGRAPPVLDFELERRTQNSVLECIRNGLVKACHDCSKGGLGVALAEMAQAGGKGALVDLRTVPSADMRDDELLFSESNSRFILTTSNPGLVLENLSKHKVPAVIAGKVGGNSLNLTMRTTKLDCNLDAVRAAYMNSLQRILEPWQK
jgi:phosphoribosylformylglycinamidine synthase